MTTDLDVMMWVCLFAWANIWSAFLFVTLFGKMKLSLRISTAVPAVLCWIMVICPLLWSSPSFRKPVSTIDFIYVFSAVGILFSSLWWISYNCAKRISGDN